MADKLTPERRSENMRRIKSKGMKPELAVRQFVRRLGHRYRLHRKDLPGKPDLAFGPKRAWRFSSTAAFGTPTMIRLAVSAIHRARMKIIGWQNWLEIKSGMRASIAALGKLLAGVSWWSGNVK